MKSNSTSSYLTVLLENTIAINADEKALDLKGQLALCNLKDKAGGVVPQKLTLQNEFRWLFLM